jgi:membrane protein implicated in regulation of membrane protease activity
MADATRTSLVTKINDVLATRLTMFVGTIWAFYVFVIFGLTPIFWPAYETQILYWSNFLQLVFLPIITVGTAILSRDARARAEQDHETIQQEFALLKEAQSMLHKSLNEIGVGVKELLIESQRSHKVE